MAVRNPTGFATWKPNIKLASKQPILSSMGDNAINDQIYMLDQPMPTMLLGGFEKRTTSATFEEAGEFKVKGKDMCDVSTVSSDEISHAFAYRASVQSGTGTMVIRVTTLASNNSQTTILTTTPTWYGYYNVNAKTNDIEETITIDIRRSAGTGAVIFSGFFMVALET